MLQLMQGTAIALAAVLALRNPSFESEPGYCERFARQVFESVYPEHAEVTVNFLASARSSATAFIDTKYCVVDRVGGMILPTESERLVQAGDYLYKCIRTSGVSGHVGIAFHQPTADGGSIICVAENSSYHENPDATGNVNGAKGYRNLDDFGPYEVLVRFDKQV